MKRRADAPADDPDLVDTGLDTDAAPAPDDSEEPDDSAELEDMAEPEDLAEPEDVDEPAPALTEREREILTFERKWWKHAGAKEQAIRDEFELSATRYYRILNGLLDNPAALAHDPVLVGRLRRIRTTRARARHR